MKLEWGLTAGNAEGEVDRLLEQMRRAFDGPCRGCMELMNDCFLLQLPRHLRQGGRPEDFGRL